MTALDTVGKSERRQWWLNRLAVVLMMGAIAWGSYNRGFAEATAKADAERIYVNEKMDKMGFCGWVLHDFNRHCTEKYGLRPSPSTSGGTDD